MLSNKTQSSRLDSIPKEIIFQHETNTSNKVDKECDCSDCSSCSDYSDWSGVMSPCYEASDTLQYQISCKNEQTTELKFNGGIVSLSSEFSTHSELPELSPLDYRVQWSFDENTHLIDCLSNEDSISMSDKVSMEVDSFCEKRDNWGMESIHGDSLCGEEDISSIPEWISNTKDIWTC